MKKSGSVWTNVTLDQLLLERQHEFMAEGKRWHDLVRTGKVLTVMAAADAMMMYPTNKRFLQRMISSSNSI